MSGLASLTASTLAVTLLAGSIVPPPAQAQDRLARVDSIFGFATAGTPGCAVGVSQQGKVVVNRSYGLANVETRAPLTRSSLFDIGSTQKQFTAAAMLLLAEEGRLSLGDDIRKYLPELPDYGRTVTIDNLLTHTGGIRDWTGMLPMAPEGTDVLSLIMRQRGLEFAPGEAWSYSTSGFELAKEVVARASGMSFAEFTRKRLFEPLGMTSTAYVPDILQAGADAALGYQKDGNGWKPFMRLGTNRGGGAIVSTIGDLLTWNDALTSGRLGRFVTMKLQEPVRLKNGRVLRYARGLIVDSTPGGVVVSHSGGAAGFSTWMGRVPEHGLSVAVACNFDPVSATALGGRVAELFLPSLAPGSRRPAPAAASNVDVSGRVGLYFDERTGEPMRLAVAPGGRLAIANGPQLIASSPDTFRPARGDLFFRSQDEFTMSFPDSDHLEIRSMEGEVTRYRRARPWAPIAADLQALAGRYESPELGAVYEIVPTSDAITMRLTGSPEKSVELTPVDRDIWMVRMMTVRFARDSSGRATGFIYGNPVVHGISFRRLGDLATASGPAPALLPVSKDPAAAPPAPAAASRSASTPPPLDGLTGEYELAPGRTLSITLENGRLVGQPASGAKRALTHESGTTFTVPESGITMRFTIARDGRPTALVMRQNGRERTLPKVR